MPVSTSELQKLINMLEIMSVYFIQGNWKVYEMYKKRNWKIKWANLYNV